MGARGKTRVHEHARRDSKRLQRGRLGPAAAPTSRLPHLEATDSFFDLFALNGYELGFWWGRSVEIPYGFNEDGWARKAATTAIISTTLTSVS